MDDWKLSAVNVVKLEKELNMLVLLIMLCEINVITESFTVNHAWVSAVVSLTSILCKIMEQFIWDYIIQHFFHNDLFSNNQFGFLKGRSTMLQLLHIMEEWTSTLEKGGQINTIYADFEKAFDKVPHHLLLKKLHSYNLNVNIIQWIRSFLCYRSQ